MIFSEPPRTPYDLNFVLAGVPVRVHPFFWLMSLMLVGFRPGARLATLLIWTAAVFISILVHEFGHVLAFRRYGVDSHVVLHGFGGLAIPHTARRISPWAHIFISFAGPAAGFLLVACFYAGMKLSGHPVDIGFGGPLLVDYYIGRFDSLNVTRLMYDLFEINIFWGLINLLPIYPLDGGQISRELFSVYHPRDAIRQSLMLSIVVAIGVVVFSLVKLQDTYLAIMFGYLGYISYVSLQQYTGGYGGRGW